jgi:hypothetical protein
MQVSNGPSSTDGRGHALARSMRTSSARFGCAAFALAAILSLSACETGSTDVSDGATGPTETAQTGPTQTTGPTAATGPTGATVLEGTWSGTWDTDIPQVHGKFSWTIEATPNGFTGMIDIQDTSCVSNGKVDVALDGDTITVGSIQGRAADHVHGHGVRRHDVRHLRRECLPTSEHWELGSRPIRLAAQPKRP